VNKTVNFNDEPNAWRAKVSDEATDDNLAPK
jgi:hypothetical protein